MTPSRWYIDGCYRLRWILAAICWLLPTTNAPDGEGYEPDRDAQEWHYAIAKLRTDPIWRAIWASVLKQSAYRPCSGWFIDARTSDDLCTVLGMGYGAGLRRGDRPHAATA
ncbi:MAG: hypothetical protein F6K28_61095 [Microcoleus sp. SIO2G3]|nr:hypothetical protein [Microcoleus sp. SIO2G3]